MRTWLLKSSPHQSRPEELANSLSHGIGVVAVLIGAPVLLWHAVRLGDPAFIVGTSIFLATILLLYTSSTIYHVLEAGKAKRFFHVLDHSFIYVLIAGTYTPFTLGVLRGPWGWTLFGIVWALAGTGVALKAFGKASNPIVSTVLFLLLGWVVVIALGPVIRSVPTSGVLWLLAGGLSYTAGVFFFALGSRLRYGHLIWHLFVLVGTGCHFFAVLWYAA